MDQPIPTKAFIAQSSAIIILLKLSCEKDFEGPALRLKAHLTLLMWQTGGRLERKQQERESLCESERVTVRGKKGAKRGFQLRWPGMGKSRGREEKPVIANWSDRFAGPASWGANDLVEMLFRLLQKFNLQSCFSAEKFCWWPTCQILPNCSVPTYFLGTEMKTLTTQG